MGSATNRYSRLMIIVHWLTAVCVVVAYVLSEGGPRVRTDPPVLHFLFGFAVLVLLVPRLLSRLLGGVPPLENVEGKWLTLAAKLGHGALYLLLVAVPLTGWYVVSQLGVSVSFLGVALPALTEARAGRPGPIADLHQISGNLILILAGLHAAAALWHHFVRHDSTMRRMSPF